jgi:hypothetical protein
MTPTDQQLADLERRVHVLEALVRQLQGLVNTLIP